MKFCPDFLKNPLKFLRWIIALLGISSSIVYLSHFIHTHEIMHKTIFNIQCQGFIEMLMSDDIKRSVFLQHSMLPGLMFDSIMIMLSRTCKDIVRFPDIYIILIRFRPVVDVYRRKVHDNVFGILCFICFDFFLKFSQCSFIVFYLSNDWFCDVHAHYCFL